MHKFPPEFKTHGAHLPPALLRSICGQPLGSQSMENVYVDTGLCTRTEVPLVALLIPGIGNSGDPRILTLLADAIREGLHGRVLPEVGPGPWALGKDVISYAAELERHTEAIAERISGCRFVFVAFSLGGLAVLYYLAHARRIPELTAHPPLVVTLASPLRGSTRYQQAVSSWRCAQQYVPPTALDAVAEQLAPSSDVTHAVRFALARHDVHSLISVGDRIVDEHAARVPGHTRVQEIDCEEPSLLKRHFYFPRHPGVIAATIDILRAHVGAERPHLRRMDSSYRLDDFNPDEWITLASGRPVAPSVSDKGITSPLPSGGGTLRD